MIQTSILCKTSNTVSNGCSAVIEYKGYASSSTTLTILVPLCDLSFIRSRLMCVLSSLSQRRDPCIHEIMTNLLVLLVLMMLLWLVENDS